MPLEIFFDYTDFVGFGVLDCRGRVRLIGGDINVSGFVECIMFGRMADWMPVDLSKPAAYEARGKGRELIVFVLLGEYTFLLHERNLKCRTHHSNGRRCAEC